jgi:integrase
MNETFSVHFIGRAVRGASTELYLYAKVSFEYRKKEFGLKIRVPADKWNQRMQCLDSRKEEHRAINYRLDQVKANLIRIYSDLRFQRDDITVQLILDVYQGKNDGKKTIHTLLEIFKQHNERANALEGIDLTKASILRFNTTYQHTVDFLEQVKDLKDIPLSALNNGFLKDMELFIKTKKKCNHNTTVKYLRIVMKVVRLAMEYNWIDKDPFMGFKLRLEEVTRGHLLEDELECLETKEISNYRIGVVRDLFVFCCYTGLAYADVTALKKVNITTELDGTVWLKINRKKTGVKSHVPLLPKALAIIEKYNDNPECDVTGRILPLRSNVKYNAYLKEVADLCGISKNLTTHLARHTFATTVTLNNDVPIESVSQMLGHKNLKTTQLYAKVLDKKVKSDMLNLKNKMDGKG